MKSLLALCLFALLSSILSYADSLPTITRMPLAKETYMDLTTDDLGFVYVAGAVANDSSLSKIDPRTGLVIWKKTFPFSISGNGDLAKKVRIANSRIYLLCDVIEGPPPPGGGMAYTNGAYNADTVLAQLTMNGDLINTARISRTEIFGTTTIKYNDNPLDLAIASDGTVFISGTTGTYNYGTSATPYGDFNWLMAGISSSGSLLWTRTYKGDYSEFILNALNTPVKIFLDATGNPTYFGNIDNIATYSDVAVLKLNRLNGDILVEKQISDAGSVHVHAMTDIAFSNGSFYLASVGYDASGSFGMFVLKLDSNFTYTQRSPMTIGEGMWSTSGNISVASNGKVYLSGTVDAHHADGSFNPDSFVTAYNVALQQEWTSLQNNGALDANRALVTDCYGSIYQISHLNLGSYQDYSVRALSASGATRWSQTYNNSFNRPDSVLVAKMTKTGLYLITLGAETTGAINDKTLIRYAMPICISDPRTALVTPPVN